MKKYYEIEDLKNGTYEGFENLEDCKRSLEKILYDEANYNYKINKNNTYAILESQYDSEENIEDYDGEISSDYVLGPISVEEFKDMEYEDKKKLFDIVAK